MYRILEIYEVKMLLYRGLVHNLKNLATRTVCRPANSPIQQNILENKFAKKQNAASSKISQYTVITLLL